MVAAVPRQTDRASDKRAASASPIQGGLILQADAARCFGRSGMDHHSQLPRVQGRLAISIVDSARPGGEGLMSRANRRLPGRVGTRPVGYLKPPAVRAQIMAWARSET